MERSAFTLIEMIGVLAVIAILASMMVPVVVKQVDQAAWNKEVTDLGAISNAIVLEALRNKSITNETGWADAAANWLARPASQILANPRGIARAFVIDNALQLGGGPLPYVQTASGTTIPVGARVMVLSSIGAALPIGSGPIATATFNDIWNTPALGKPSLGGSWGSGEDLIIQRINLEPLFYRLILVNRSGDPAAFVTIDTNAPTSVGGLDAYYLAGTAVGLSSNQTLQVRSSLTRNVSYAFENGTWQGQISDGSPAGVLANTFATASGNFLIARGNPKGGSQMEVLGRMCNLMLDYTVWTNTSSAVVSLDTANLATNAGPNGTNGLLYK